MKKLKQFSIIIGIALIIFASFFIIISLTQQTKQLVPTISTSPYNLNTSLNKTEVSAIKEFIPYADIKAVEPTNNPLVFLFDQDLFSIDNFVVNIKLVSRTLIKYSSSVQGGAIITKHVLIKKQDLTHPKQRKPLQLYLYQIKVKPLTKFLPKYLQIRYTDHYNIGNIMIPLLQRNNKLKNYIKVSYTNHQLIVSAPNDYIILWGTNGYNHFFIYSSIPEQNNNTLIYKYQLSDTYILPQFIYVYHNNQFTIIPISSTLLENLSNNLYSFKFNTLKEFPNINYKIINHILIIKDDHPNEFLTFFNKTTPIMNNVNFIKVNQTKYYYVNLYNFKEPNLTLRLDNGSHHTNINIKIPTNTVYLKAIDYTLTKAQFYSILILLSIILSNFIYVAIESIYHDKICETKRSTTKPAPTKKRKIHKK